GAASRLDDNPRPLGRFLVAWIERFVECDFRLALVLEEEQLVRKTHLHRERAGSRAVGRQRGLDGLLQRGAEETVVVQRELRVQYVAEIEIVCAWWQINLPLGFDAVIFEETKIVGSHSNRERILPEFVGRE